MLSRVARILGFKSDSFRAFAGDNKIILDQGNTVPTATTAGYAVGALFLHRDGAEGTALYVNEGTEASCTFAAVASLTAAQEALLGATAGTVAASKALIVDASKNLISMGRLTQGAVASAAGSGVVLASATPSVLLVCADDNGANIADSVFTIRGRTLLTLDQSAGSIRSVAGHLKLAAGVDVTTGVYTGVQGYVEMVGTHIAKTGSVFSAVDSSTEIVTSLTIDSGGRYAGVHVETTGAGTITNNGTCAGVLVDKATGAASWPVGIQINCDSVTRGIQVGTLGSNITSGVPILNATSINGLYSDDNGADQTTGTVHRNLTVRTYYSVNQTAASADYHALRGHVKVASGVNLGGDASVKSAVNGHFELAGATTVGAGSFSASVFGEIWTDGNLVGTGKVAGVMSRFYSSAGTATGIVAAFLATKQWASTQSWLYGLYIDSATCDIRLANAGGAGIYSKTSTPNGALTAPKGSICIVSSGSGAGDRAFINTDAGTTWTAIVTSA